MRREILATLGKTLSFSYRLLALLSPSDGAGGFGTSKSVADRVWLRPCVGQTGARFAPLPFNYLF